jgi:hypothetical protein
MINPARQLKAAPPDVVLHEGLKGLQEASEHLHLKLVEFVSVVVESHKQRFKMQLPNLGKRD